MQKHAILVVGTGRSGTSAMTGALQILGTHLGDSLTEGNLHNPKGYFENTEIVNLNKALLSAAGVIWYAPPISNVQALPTTQETCQAIHASIQGVFKDRTPIAIKDPRLCALLGPYVSVLTAMEYQVHCVLMSRHIDEVARSMETATGVCASTYLPMVQHYAALLESALNQTAVHCIRCTFSELLTDTKTTIKQVARLLPFLSCSDDQMSQILSFVDKSLRHHDMSGVRCDPLL
jgi:hypothetical protein